MGSLVLFLIKPVLLGVKPGSCTKKKLKIAGPDAHLPLWAVCFLSKVRVCILIGVGGANGGNGRDLKLGAFLGHYPRSTEVCQRGLELIEVVCLRGRGKFPKEHVPKGHINAKGSIHVVFVPLERSGMVLGSLIAPAHF